MNVNHLSDMDPVSKTVFSKPYQAQSPLGAVCQDCPVGNDISTGRSAGQYRTEAPLDVPMDGKEVACRFTHSRDYAAQRTVPKEWRIIRDYVQSMGGKSSQELVAGVF